MSVATKKAPKPSPKRATSKAEAFVRTGTCGCGQATDFVLCNACIRARIASVLAGTPPWALDLPKAKREAVRRKALADRRTPRPVVFADDADDEDY